MKDESNKKTTSKKTFLIIAVCLVLSICIGLVIFLPVTYKIDKTLISKNEEYNVMKVNGKYATLVKTDNEGNYLDDDFKIIAFTDFHLDTYKDKGNVTLEMLIRNVVSQKPDLVVFVGDNITSALNGRRAKQLGELMEELSVYWTFVLGNHEGDNIFSISRQRMVDLFASYPHCLVDNSILMTKNGERVSGVGNHVINILDSKGDIRQSLYFLDSGSEMNKDDLEKYADEIKINNNQKYDYIKDSQIQWYRETVNDINAIANKTVKSVIFDHIPLVEFHTAYELANSEDPDSVLLSGTRLETVCSSGHNSGLFDVILELGSTKAFISGHDHINDFAVSYKGVILAYNQNSGYSSYNLVTKGKSDTLMQGFSVYIIDKDGNLSMNSYMNADLYPDMQKDILKLYK